MTQQTARHKILFVDDDPGLRDLARDALETIVPGCTVATAHEGGVAWEMMWLHPWDLVITDLAMPGISGVQLIKRIRGKFPKTRILAISGIFTADDGNAAMSAGADAFLRKPFKIDKLLATIGDLLDSVEAPGADSEKK